jgi:hypothetical protein
MAPVKQREIRDCELGGVDAKKKRKEESSFPFFSEWL